MGANTLEELVLWQLAEQLRKEIVDVSGAGAFAKDFKLRDQIRGAANSSSANIAEGFKRFHPREFGQFVKYARASLAEMKVHLADAKDRGYITPSQHAELSKLAARTAIAAARLHSYLRKAKAPDQRQV